MATPSPLDINNVQGDILEGLGKKQQSFLFFRIKSGQASRFREDLRSFVPLVTNTTEAKKFHHTIKEGKKEAAKQGKPFPLIDHSSVNIGFSQKGLNALGFSDDIGDATFKRGMVDDAGDLGDDLADWDANFKKEIHGIFTVTANNGIILERTFDHIKRIFRAGGKDATIEQVARLSGKTRPGAENGHEQ
ncbi:hypothetical protein NUW58_g6269 [Xylaria curta]|uniref:Uncharacterized protein n=1 Tax=Xylaria curta TaxID=42375 RepID=A0ACC1NVH9_9PEZI|nr:hypothetical protein NUW58_g6269 [Xylaria curta]